MIKRLLVLFFIFVFSYIVYGQTHEKNLLLYQGAEVNINDNNNDTILMQALIFGQIDIGTFLLAKELLANSSDTTLMPVQKGYAGSQFLFEKNPDLNSKANTGNTTLMNSDYANIAKLLLNRNANLNMKDNNQGLTILLNALFIGQSDLAVLLIKRNANNQLGQTATKSLIYNSQFNNTQLEKYLLDKGFDINAKVNDAKAPFEDTDEHGITKIMKLLNADDAKE